MRGKGKCRAFPAALAFLLCLSLPAASVSTDEVNLVWFADHKTLSAIDVSDNTIAQRIELHHAPDALAVDVQDSGIWALIHRQLLKFDVSGTAIRELELRHWDLGFGEPELLAANPYDGTLWVATERSVVRFSPEGERLAYWRVPARIKAFALELDESLWVLTQRALFHVSPIGTVIESLDLGNHRIQPRHLAVDSLGGVLWIGGKQHLLKFSLDRLADPPQLLSLGSEEEWEEADEHEHVKPRRKRFGDGHIHAIDVHPLFGTLWVAGRHELTVFDRAGTRLKSVGLPAPARHVNALAFDSRGLGLWVAGKDGVARFTGSGELVTTLLADKEPELLAASGFTLHPTAEIFEPADGSLTNNPRPRLRLSLGARCSGTPCLLPNAYMQSLNLDIDLNGEAVGERFTVVPPEAYYEPQTRLPEGENTLNAAATDLFGHRSPTASSAFTVDTIPPEFVTLLPADGSEFMTDSIVIEGSVDDPTANVILAAQDGSGISLAGAVFSFSVLLKAGPNTFLLTARDPAGNEAVRVLHVTYNPVRVQIMRPTASATLTTRGVIVSGEFEGPPNTGVTVNGAIARVFGNRFYANLSLESGPNTLTALATAPSGAAASDTLTITVDPPPSEPISIIVEPQSGIAPLAVRFGAESNTPAPVVELAIDTDGDGTVDLRVENPAGPVEHTYGAPGVFETRVTATDSGGQSSTQTVAIVINDGQQMDQLFAALWGGMNDALVQGDIPAAAAFLNEGARRKYQPVFEALKPHFPEIVASYSLLRRVSISADIGEYAIVRPNKGKNQLYLIYFLRDADGVWRLDAM